MLSCDCHAHVFGPFDRYPLPPERSYDPPLAPAAAHLAMLDRIGFGRGVVVQASAHGLDSSTVLDALDTAPGRLRGIAVAEASISDAKLEDMHRRGVRGLRFTEVGYKGGAGFDALTKLAPRLKRLGWHAQLWAPCDALAAQLPRLLKLGLRFSVDHMGYFDAARGAGDAAFRKLVELAAAEDIWIKMTPLRVSKIPPDYPDVRPFHDALLRASPRLIWGSDWPHVRMDAPPDVGHLVELFLSWTADAGLRHKFLVENPRQLYDFSPD